MVPVQKFDIFDPNKISQSQALFSDRARDDPTLGWSFGDSMRLCKYTLEGYWVDKQLSSRISLDFVEEAVRRIEAAVDKQLNGGPNDYKHKALAREVFYTSVLQRFGEQGDTFASNWLAELWRSKVNHISSTLNCRNNAQAMSPEVHFVMRVTDRLCAELEQKISAQMELPVRKNMWDSQDGSKSWTFGCTFYSEKNSPDEKAHEDLCNNFFDQRDREVVRILREGLEKDKEARQKDPNAPLTNFVTLTSYETEIENRRKKTIARIFNTLSHYAGIAVTAKLRLPARTAVGCAFLAFAGCSIWMLSNRDFCRSIRIGALSPEFTDILDRLARIIGITLQQKPL